MSSQGGIAGICVVRAMGGREETPNGADERWKLTPARPVPIPLQSLGRTVPVIAFYCPGDGLTAWDQRTSGAPLANFWPLPNKLELEWDGAKGEFRNSEAAYQALKWWHHERTRRAFEACDTADLAGAEAAFRLKRQCEHDEGLGEWVTPNFAGQVTAPFYAWARLRAAVHRQTPPAHPPIAVCVQGKFDAMLAVLRLKWRLAGFREFLIATAGSLLVEHSEVNGRDPYWTDDCSGGGQNRLGGALMMIRDELLSEDERSTSHGMTGSRRSGWPDGIARPAWARGATAGAAEGQWQTQIDEVAAQLSSWRESERDPVHRDPVRGSVWSLPNIALCCAWGTLAVVFSVAYVQGEAFASTKDSATVWGGVIGLAAFFAWIAVEDDDDDDGEGEAEGEGEGEGKARAGDNAEGGGESTKDKKPHAD